MNTVKFGIVGTSWWAGSMYAPAIASHPRASLVACCGRNLERTKAFAEEYGIGQWFLDAREMIDRADLDAIIIATPEYAHHDICVAAARAGLHVACEKPLGMNLAEAEAMLAAVEAADVKHLSYFTWRWFPHMRHARLLVSEGYVGEIYEARFTFLGGLARSGEPHWKFDRRTGLGALGDLGSHLIDAALWLVGPIEHVDANVTTFFDRSGPGGDEVEAANDSALLRVRFDNGGHGMIEASHVAHLGKRAMEFGIELRGADGTLQIAFDFERGWRSWGVHGDGSGGPLEIPGSLTEGLEDVSDEGPLQAFAKQDVGIRLFVDALLEGRNVEPSLADGLEVQRVMEAALESSRLGSRLRVE